MRRGALGQLDRRTSQAGATSSWPRRRARPRLLPPLANPRMDRQLMRLEAAGPQS